MYKNVEYGELRSAFVSGGLFSVYESELTITTRIRTQRHKTASDSTAPSRNTIAIFLCHGTW